MKYGAMAHGQNTSANRNNTAEIGQQFAASPVNIIDSIVITEELDPSRILAEWIAYDPGIAVYSELSAAQAVKLFINWSDRNGTVDLHQGDYFTFVIPDIFVYDYITDVTNSPITNEAGEIVATYSIYDNANNMKEVKIVFTDYVENHANVSGDFWMRLYVGSVASTEQKTLEFVINDTLVAQGGVTVNPSLEFSTPKDHKVGFSSPTMIAGGFYIFEWLVYFNMGENAVNGFNTLEDFSFEDIIPADSPHVFLTDTVRQELGLLPNDYVIEIGEYMGADSVPPESRYQTFLNQYNSAGSDSWYNYMQWHTMRAGLTTVGIGGNAGLHITDIEVAEKLFSAGLGTITRPTIITFYTASTIRLSESALGDSEVVGLFKDVFSGSYGEDLTSSLTLYRFEAGGSAQGITGDYSFAVTKVNEAGAVLPGAMFALYTSDDFTAGADRFVFSGSDGVVAFNNLPLGTYYFQETGAPYGYRRDNAVYKVILSSDGFEVYYGPDFENLLSDNTIINRSEFELVPVLVILPGRKNLGGSSLVDGMFNFVVKDSGGNVVATGINNADGSIQFSSIVFKAPGVFAFTVEEIKGTDSGIIYDDSVFPVTVAVTDDGSGTLTAEVSYPNGGIVFNNRYVTTPTSIILKGRKSLTGVPLLGGMFSFVVKDSGGKDVATGINTADGGIQFSSITFNGPGIFTFTVEEVRGTISGITYDSSKFAVTVTVTNDGSGTLTAEVNYPDGDIVFNNRCLTTPTGVCQCYIACCQVYCKPCCSLHCMPCHNNRKPVSAPNVSNGVKMSDVCTAKPVWLHPLLQTRYKR